MSEPKLDWYIRNITPLESPGVETRTVFGEVSKRLDEAKANVFMSGDGIVVIEPNNDSRATTVASGMSWESPGIDPIEAIETAFKNEEEARKHWLPNSKP